MKCILLRHGIAVDAEIWNEPDSERPLTREGIKKTHKAITGLSLLDCQPTHLLSSPFVRARETAELVLEIFNLHDGIQFCEELAVHHSPTTIFPILTTFPEEATVMCIGHEPHLGQLAAIMISGRYIPGLSLKKAGACAIQFEEKPKIGCGWLEWWLRPGQLRQLGKHS
ncbi:MAG: phosphohistidine phosphatase SixA [Nitrospirales bacterium]|nr:MAG: phosphohistidine phosphatase SixA [Nitrospirales bacterium]